MNNVTITATGGDNAEGVLNNDSDATITNAVISGTGGSDSYGVIDEGTSNSVIRNSVVTGSNQSVWISGATTRLVNNELIGSVGDSDSGTKNCFGNYKPDLTTEACND